MLLSGGLWGLFQAKKLWDRERLLLDLSSLLRRCAASIRYAGRPVGEWVRQEEKASRFCWEAARRPCFAADPRTALEQAGKRRPSWGPAWEKPGRSGRGRPGCTWPWGCSAASPCALPCCDRPERKEGKALWTWI